MLASLHRHGTVQRKARGTPATVVYAVNPTRHDWKQPSDACTSSVCSTMYFATGPRAKNSAEQVQVQGTSAERRVTPAVCLADTPLLIMAY